MERFSRTLREGGLDHLGSLASLHDVEVRLLALLDQHYAPSTVFNATPRPPDTLDEATLRAALTVRERRRVRADTTVSWGGQDYELDQGYLAGRVVTIGSSPIGGEAWVEHDGLTFPLHPVDPRANAHRKRPPRRPGEAPRPTGTPFDPAGALLAPPPAAAPTRRPPDERRLPRRLFPQGRRVLQ